MTKIDIFSGFLGAGKTTLIKKLISEVFAGEKVVLIENEFGDIAIDGGFLQDAGVVINEMNSGCICCSLVGDFRKALHKVLEELHPDRILIEPSGVGKLSDVIRAVQAVSSDDVVLNSFTTVADAKKCKMYMKNFGEFYNDQIEHANCIVLSRTANMAEDKIEEVVAMLREHNQVATIITTDWEKVTGQQIVEAMEHTDTLEEELEKLAKEAVHEHHHHHHHHDGEECDDEECECHHHHHDDDDEDEEHEHHHHHHHHDHDADEIFTSWGMETSKTFTQDEIKAILAALGDEAKYGIVLRAKGIVAGKDGEWIHFDYVPEETSVRTGSAIVRGRFCVIGSELKEKALKELFL